MFHNSTTPVLKDDNTIATMYYKLIRYYQANPRTQADDHIAEVTVKLREFITNYGMRRHSEGVPAGSHMFSSRFCCGCGRTTVMIPEDFRIVNFHVYACFHCNDQAAERVYDGSYNPVALLSKELTLSIQRELDRVASRSVVEPLENF